MATTVQINAICDAVLAAFDSDPVKWSNHLIRSSLTADLAEIESRYRNKAAEIDTEASGGVAELAAIAAEKAAKIAQIDAL